MSEIESEKPQKAVGKKQRTSKLRDVLETIGIFAVAFLVVWLLQLFVIKPYNVPTGSMIPTIEEGDYIFSEKISYYFEDPQAGDIVTFHDPTTEGQILVKRCIAVAGQTVDIQDGVLYIDGVAQSEEYVHGKPSEAFEKTYLNKEISYPYTVPEGCIWVMGDNRTNSADSRYFGAVAVSSLTGHACFTYWPVSSFGILR